MQISSDHPLRKLFEELVRRHFHRSADLYDPDVIEYVGGVLTDFTHTDRLYRIHNARGRRLEEVAEMLVESNPKLQDVLRDQLKKSGFRVLVTADPQRPMQWSSLSQTAAECEAYRGDSSNSSTSFARLSGSVSARNA